MPLQEEDCACIASPCVGGVSSTLMSGQQRSCLDAPVLGHHASVRQPCRLAGGGRQAECHADLSLGCRGASQPTGWATVDRGRHRDNGHIHPPSAPCPQTTESPLLTKGFQLSLGEKNGNQGWRRGENTPKMQCGTHEIWLLLICQKGWASLAWGACLLHTPCKVNLFQ